MTAPAASAHPLFVLLGRRRCAPGSVVVDVASDDAGELAAAVQDAGFVPLGVSVGQAGADHLTSMGVQVVTGDLSTPDALFQDAILALGERHAAVVWLGDLPARMPDMAELVRAAHWFCEQTGAALALSVPNVTHVDVGTKLLLGRWEPRSGGVLDDANVRRFSDASLRSAMLALGWAEVDAEDVERPESDQHFPSDAVPLERTTPSGGVLASLRELAGPGAYVSQLVRLYDAVLPELPDADAGAGDPFLSVLVRTQGKRWETLQETLLCLAAQRCDDFEVLVLVHDPEPGAARHIEDLVSEFHPSFSLRVRVMEIHGGGRCRPLNVGAGEARGRYLATLDDDDLVFAHWVEAMRTAAGHAPGHAIRVGVATQQIAATQGTRDGADGADGYDVISRPRVDYPLTFDHVEHLRDNLTPNNGYAVPRWVVTELGQGWDESLPVLEDWDHLLRSAEICGVADAHTVAAMIRVWANAENSKTVHRPGIWEQTRRRIVAQHDAAPLLLDRGYVSRLRALLSELDAAAELEVELERRAQEIEQLHREIARLTDEARRALGEARRALGEAHGLKVHNERLTQEIRKLTGEVERLSGDVDRLNGELGQALGEVHRLNGVVAGVEGQVVELHGELALSEERRRI
ncbi:MAG TPA: glycosyltransferase, partial [Acidimicrobiales bacterium]|nr:glycosyltransferase [Acidimicrobiales bacterium]